MKNHIVSLLVLWPVALTAQSVREIAPLKNWPAPLYWQPSQAEAEAAALSDRLLRRPTTFSQTPGNSLVFVAMTPCRVVDTRGNGFNGAFGPPSLAGSSTRSFPIHASTTCSIPGIAQAYSFNVTVVPAGFLGYLTIWPVGAAQPVVSTLNDSLGVVAANAAIVPAGNDVSGSVNVFVTNNTDLVIDINGYYASPSDASGNTAIGTGALGSNTTGYDNTATGGGALQSNVTGSYNTAFGYLALQGNSIGFANTAVGSAALSNNATGNSNTAIGELNTAS